VNKLVNKLSWRLRSTPGLSTAPLQRSGGNRCGPAWWLLQSLNQGWQDRRYRYGRRSCTTDEPQCATAKTCSFM